MLTTNYSMQSAALLSDATSQQEDGLLDFVTYGAAAAVISGATGLLNTAIGVGEMLGVADSSSYIDETRAVTSFLGKEGGEFYLRHKTGIDLAGFVASSIVPGVAGVRALRLAQRSGIITDPLRYATGARNADILLDSPLVHSASQRALQRGSNTMFSNPEYFKAVSAGAKQQVLENVAFEAAVVLTNNQNALLNPEDLGYLEATGSQIVAGLPYVALGAGLGTAIDVFRINGQVKRNIASAHTAVVAVTPAGEEITAGMLRNLRLPEMAGRNEGDAIIFMARESQARTHMERQLYVKDGNGAEILPEDRKFAYNNIKDSQHILREEFHKVVSQMNEAGEAGYQVLTDLFHNIANASGDSKYALAAATKLRPISSTALGDAPNATWESARKRLDAEALSAQASDADRLAALRNSAKEDALGIAARLAAVGFTDIAPETTNLLRSHYGELLSSLRTADYDKYGSDILAIAALRDELVARAPSKTVARTMEQQLKELDMYLPQERLVAFINRSSKEVRTNVNPSLADTHKLKAVGSGANSRLLDPANGKVYHYNGQIFGNISKVTSTHLDRAVTAMDTNFVLAHKEKVHYNTTVQLDSTDIARMERVLFDALRSTDSPATKALTEGRVLVGGSSVSVGQLSTMLVQRKLDALTHLQNIGADADSIAKAVNVSRAVVLGDEALSTSNVMARSDWEQPQWLQIEYKNRNIADYERDVDQFVGQSHRDKLYQTQKQMAIAELGYADVLADLPVLDLKGIDHLTQLEGRTGMLTRVDSDFGTVRESATYIGKQVNNINRKLQADVIEDFAAIEKKFNDPTAGVLRAELELTVNFLRTGDVTAADAVFARHGLNAADVGMGNRLFDLGAFQNTARQLVPNAPDIKKMAPDDIRRVLEAMPEGSYVDATSDVMDVIRSWHGEQITSARQRAVIAEALGTHKSVDELVIRAPSVDLTQYRQVAFVRPVGGEAAANPTKYMIYAQTSEEMTERMRTVREQLGDNYMIVQKGDDAEFFKAIQEYEMGHEFRDLYADISKRNRGRTADVLPPVAQDTSRALADMKRSTLRNKQYALRASVELQNAEALEVLRRYGDFKDAPERNALTKNLTSRGSHIYTDTVALMLDLPTYRGSGNKLWNEVNTAVSQRGSKVVDWVSAQATPMIAAIDKVKEILGKASNKPQKMVWDDAAMDQLNNLLDQHHFSTPIKDSMQLVMQSTDPAVSASIDKLVRTMSNLMSLTLLRADPAHSFMQASSSVILSLPILRQVRERLPELADKWTTVTHPTTGVKEPNVAKMYAKGFAKAFNMSDADKAFMGELKKRGIVSDYIETFLDVTDMSQLSGAHGLDVVHAKLNQVAGHVSKYSGHTASEEYSRFALANAVKEMLDGVGIPTKEQWPIISNAVDKVHGNYVASQRPQLFNGVVGQSVGLFQTYFFNMMQHVTKNIEAGRGKDLALTGALQAGLFGARSIPGFGLLNQVVANRTNYDSDLYEMTDANNPDSWTAYAMWGLASQAFGIDFSGRGDLNPRYASIVPTDFQNLATVSMLTHAIGNLYNTGRLLAEDNVTVGTALAHGLAHNGMNRPLQGLGVLLQDAVTTRTGQIDVQGTRLDEAGNIAWASWASRLIGARPMDESIVRSHFYRQASYDAAHSRQMAKLAAVVQAGGVEDWGQLATDYQAAGGNLQMFNSWALRHMQTASEGKMAKFKQDMEADTALSRAVRRMQFSGSLQPYWEDGTWE